MSGGSSSGSAVSVAAGLSSFSIANDAAGSGRVPASFNNIVGIKPTPGLISNACVSGGGCVKTIETLAVFALTVEDGMKVTDVIGGYDPTYPFSKPEADSVPLTPATPPPRFRFGIPRAKLCVSSVIQRPSACSQRPWPGCGIWAETLSRSISPLSRKRSASSTRARGFRSVPSALMPFWKNTATPFIP
ncbi:amidase family protein [Rhizobium beringeri]